MYLISVEGYKNAGVHCLRIEKTGELWVNMKNVGDGLGVKNISDWYLWEKRTNKRRNLELQNDSKRNF